MMTAGLLVSLAAALAGGTLVERIVLQVNGHIITESDLRDREQSQLTELYRRELPAEELSRLLDAAREALVPQLIDETLLLQKAKALDLSVSSDQLDAVIESIMSANGLADLNALEQALSSEGLSLKTLRADIERRTLIEKLKQFEVASRIVVTDEQIKEHYDQNMDTYRKPERVHLSEIVLLAEGRDRDDVKAEIDEISRLLHNGHSFGELASLFSQAPSADHGGDMSVVELASLSDEIRKSAAKLEPGDVSPPISTKYGFHLLKLQERQKQGLRPLVDVRAEILSTLQKERYAAALEGYIRSLQEKAFIKVFPTPEGAKAYDLPATFIDG